ncbi:hypothetical protein [Actinacidiphila rubida]|uniref:Antibiotic biosynthesis monooxygenase n=1 Tax=Actinacidiphila rubida TaxID=310780 RepID=A0A1H8MIY9_9ACTN|nr:hypothetical protein [Actinacidiphila rubida]SEO17365.1 hypothetical protein SAMN05216267_10199 [Actinacidiphila rubida]
MTVTLMWEAAAADGRGAALLSWARGQAAALPGEPARREFLTAPGDRVLVITWWDAPYAAELPELADPPQELVRRGVHRWRFVSVSVEPADRNTHHPE